jgi:hypothetical protein
VPCHPLGANLPEAPCLGAWEHHCEGRQGKDAGASGELAFVPLPTSLALESPNHSTANWLRDNGELLPLCTSMHNSSAW